MFKNALAIALFASVTLISPLAATSAHAAPAKEGPSKESHGKEGPSKEGKSKEFQREFDRTKAYDKPVRRDYIGDALISGGIWLLK